MKAQAYQHGFVESCMDEGFTIKEACRLYHIAQTLLIKNAESYSQATFPTVLPPTKGKKTSVYKPMPVSIKTHLRQMPNMMPGARTPTASPAYKPLIEQEKY